MSFISITYALLLATVFMVYWLVLRRWLVWQNALLLAASYWFYAWWDWRFLSLIVFTTISTYATARMAGRWLAAGDRGKAKMATAANIVVNLGILVAFKYFNFFGENLARLFELFGLGLDWVTLDVLLPVGISFYTFQAIGYSVDVYRGDTLPERSLLNFATFVAFFPQLVAGPIERSRHLLPQISAPRHWDYARSVDGMRQILWGLAKKVVMADFVGVAIANIYDDPMATSASVAMAAVLFSFQIYGDFSGYSDIAIGSAKLLGIRLTQNFRYPYQAASVGDFWRRWHISLMAWFRDYVYIPLGGSHKGRGRTLINIAIVFLLSGLWHGAEWTFVGWGAYWAVVMIIERLLSRNRQKPEAIPSLKQLPRILFVFIISTIGWMIFSAENFSVFLDNFLRLFSGSILSAPKGLQSLAICAVFYVVEWIGRRQEYPLQSLRMARPYRWAIYWAILIAILWYQTLNISQFIYFQF